eukprot:5036651-Prymnesium_polylepis.1
MVELVGELRDKCERVRDQLRSYGALAAARARHESLDVPADFRAVLARQSHSTIVELSMVAPRRAPQPLPPSSSNT